MLGTEVEEVGDDRMGRHVLFVWWCKVTEEGSEDDGAEEAAGAWFLSRALGPGEEVVVLMFWGGRCNTHRLIDFLLLPVSNEVTNSDQNSRAEPVDILHC